MPMGLKLRVPAAELHEHFTTRQKHHEGRADFYQKQMDAMRAAGVVDALAAAPSWSNSSRGESPYAAAERARRDHLQKAARFAFIVNHLIDEDYIVTENEVMSYDSGYLFTAFYSNATGTSVGGDDETD